MYALGSENGQGLWHQALNRKFASEPPLDMVEVHNQFPKPSTFGSICTGPAAAGNSLALGASAAKFESLRPSHRGIVALQK